MTATNQTQKSVLGEKIRVARNFIERLRGLLGTSRLEDGEGLLIPSCQGVHMFGMRYSLDIIYLDRNGKVLKLINGLPPNAIGAVDFRAHSVLELPAGVIGRTRTQVGDLLTLC